MLPDLLRRKTTSATGGGLDGIAKARQGGGMIARLRQHRFLRLACLLPALPFVLLSLVAPGYMPGRGDDGMLTMVICADGAMVEMVMDAATGAPADRAAPEDGRCAWAQAALALAVPGQPDLPPPLRLVHRLHPAAPDDLWRPAHDPRGLFARGPPRPV